MNIILSKGLIDIDLFEKELNKFMNRYWNKTNIKRIKSYLIKVLKDKISSFKFLTINSILSIYSTSLISSYFNKESLIIIISTKNFDNSKW